MSHNNIIVESYLSQGLGDFLFSYHSYQYDPPRTKPHDHMYTVQSYKNVRVWSEAYIYIHVYIYID
jgi:hypothetical protein